MPANEPSERFVFVFMQRINVDSKDLKSVGYDETTSILEIEFNSGGVYQYLAVPVETYNNLMNAVSHGKYFHAFIMNHYKSIKIQ